ncbi:hypothetical protein J6590_020222 [Homalodisca vitripennis]|nr:hypothetical protein J6590_020222 [Homalodisca vitripennis]
MKGSAPSPLKGLGATPHPPPHSKTISDKAITRSTAARLITVRIWDQKSEDGTPLYFQSVVEKKITWGPLDSVNPEPPGLVPVGSSTTSICMYNVEQFYYGAGLTGMEACMLLHVAELLEASLAVRALVGLLARVDSDVLNQLVIAAEGLEALLTLVRLVHLRSSPLELASVELHRRLVHEDLRQERVIGHLVQDLQRYTGQLGATTYWSTWGNKIL